MISENIDFILDKTENDLDFIHVPSEGTLMKVPMFCFVFINNVSTARDNGFRCCSLRLVETQ